MPTFRITDPEGKTWKVSGQGSEQEALAHFQDQWEPSNPINLDEMVTDIPIRTAEGLKELLVDPASRLYRGMEIPGIKKADPTAYGDDLESLAAVNPLTDIANYALIPATGAKKAAQGLGAGALVHGVGADVAAQKAADWLGENVNPEFQSEFANNAINIPTGMARNVLEMLPQLAAAHYATKGGAKGGPEAPAPKAAPVPPVEPVVNRGSGLDDLLGKQGRPMRGGVEQGPIPVWAQAEAKKPPRPNPYENRPFPEPPAPEAAPKVPAEMLRLDEANPLEIYDNGDYNPPMPEAVPEVAPDAPADLPVEAAPEVPAPDAKYMDRWLKKGFSEDEIKQAFAEGFKPGEKAKLERQAEIDYRASEGGLSPVLMWIRDNGGMDYDSMRRSGMAGELPHADYFSSKIFTKGGMSLDRIAESLHEAGLIPENDVRHVIEYIKDDIRRREGISQKADISGGAGAGKKLVGAIDRATAKKTPREKKVKQVFKNPYAQVLADQEAPKELLPEQPFNLGGENSAAAALEAFAKSNPEAYRRQLEAEQNRLKKR